MEDLPLPEGDKQALFHLAEAWTGDEIGICKAITLACEKLQSSLKKFEKESAAEEKLMTALCFSHQRTARDFVDLRNVRWMLI